MNACSSVMRTRRSLWLSRECASAILPTSDDSSYVSGSEMVIDGGALAQ